MDGLKDELQVKIADYSKVELNETNFSEVLRLFILARNAGDPHPVRNTVNNFEYDVPVSPYT